MRADNLSAETTTSKMVEWASGMLNKPEVDPQALQGQGLRVHAGKLQAGQMLIVPPGFFLAAAALDNQKPSLGVSACWLSHDKDVTAELGVIRSCLEADSSSKVEVEAMLDAIAAHHS